MANGKPLGSVNIMLNGPTTASRTTDGNGNYVFTDLPAGGNYTITPARTNTDFTPPSQPINNLRKDESANFIGREQLPLYKISVQVKDARGPLARITLRLDGAKTASATTNADGNYTFDNLPAGGNYTITPVRTNTDFTPPSQHINNLRKDESAEFTRREQSPLSFKISGRVTANGKPACSVRLMLTGTTTASTTTDASGNYAFRDLPKGGRYDLTPAGGSMRFNPPGYSFTLMRDETADFSGVVEREGEGEGEVCTDADKNREYKTIIDRFGPAWRRKIESDPPKLRANNLYVRERVSLGPIEYQSTFIRNCTGAVFTARYVWEITGPAGTERVPKQKRFTCVKLGGIWLCN